MYSAVRHVAVLCFLQVYILCDAYGVSSLWPELLHKFVVQASNLKYLHDFRAHVGLTSAVITDVADRFVFQSQQMHALYINPWVLGAAVLINVREFIRVWVARGYCIPCCQTGMLSSQY